MVSQYLMADGQAFAAECACFYTDDGYATAAACSADANAAGTPPASYVSCYMNALSGHADLLQCLITDDQTYTSCLESAGSDCTVAMNCNTGAPCMIPADVDSALMACDTAAGG